MSARLSAALLACVVALSAACRAPKARPDAPGPHSQAAGADAAAQSPAESALPSSLREDARPFSPLYDSKPIIAGISYGPYREGQRPGGPNPTVEQIREDLQIIARHWKMLRVYGSRGPSEDILRVIRDDELPLTVMLGAWIAPDDPDGNAGEVAAAIRLANTYPEQVSAVSVGNETQVYWSGHRTPPDVLVEHIREVRTAVSQPVTTADDYNFWNKPESAQIAAEIDFIVLHAYAMWNKQPLDNAVPWTAEVVASITRAHPEHSIVLGETGWATEMNPEGNEAELMVGEASDAAQATFYETFTQWAAEANQPYFYFEAFDEPWKGSDDPREVEKHWGLYHVDRTPKPAIAARPD